MLLKKIVVAEDDDAIAHMVSMVLGDAGFLCLRASDGEEALNLVRLHTPDLLVLDVMMPRLEGTEVARRIKGDVVLSKTPILMLTALAAVDNKLEGYAAGADAYMTKPFDLREFSAQAKALIRASTRERGRNPTTNLPGSGAVDDQIEAALTEKRDASVVCFEVREFGAYTDEVGFPRAEMMVASLGALMLEQVRSLPQEQVFLGHLGGTDFIAVVPREVVERLVDDVLARFESCYREWLLPDSANAPARALTMSAAVVHLDGLRRNDGGVVSDRIGEAMKAAKEKKGSGYVIWQPDVA
jgi:DNA-binding response OmpR family regulator